MSKKVKEVIALLEADGWEHKRTRGDHRIFMKAGAARPHRCARRIEPLNARRHLPIHTKKRRTQKVKSL